MGYTQFDLKMPPDYTVEELQNKISKKLRLSTVSVSIQKKSLDARKKDNIHWLLNICATAPELPGPSQPQGETFVIPYKKRGKKVVVVGSGPAGFFAAYTLQLAGFDVILIEQGPEVDTRSTDIKQFEQTGVLKEKSNYAFGEGGAGTFSDGKLTSRTKSISLEKKFIFDTYIEHGAPAEIAYLAHPHLGSDNLKAIVKNLRQRFTDKGGQFLLDTTLQDITIKNGTLHSIATNRGTMAADYFIVATGHSAYDTYRMLIRNGVPFRTKSFAVGCRVEHRQELINLAQWGVGTLPGVHAAEYRFAFKHEHFLPVYSFCMCPGGKVVPAAPYGNLNIVNGMSRYKRNSPFGNAAIVAAVNPAEFLGNEPEPLAALAWLEGLEETFFKFNNSYDAPACAIKDFLVGKVSASLASGSYPFRLVPADFAGLLPESIVVSLRAGMKDFRKKMRGFEEGIMMGLESKTSSPIQAVRDENGRSAGVENLYLCGEGSGYAGGIVSSAADGVKAASAVIAAN